MSLSPGSHFGSFEVQASLGAGGMGEVFRARDTRLGRDVALKVLPPAFATDRDRLDRLSREARALAALSHHGIAAIYDIVDVDGVRALVLEFVDGITLEQRLQGGAVPAREAIGVAKAIAEALDAAHERGMVHRDLKPANIKIAPDGTVKLLDFGIARMLFDSTGGDLTTVAGTTPGAIVGTAAYMSPEQARGQALDKRADVWAFGCVLFEMLTGRAPFRGSTWSDSIAQTLTGEPDWNALPADTPPRLIHLIERCLRKEPKERLRGLGGVELAFDERAPAAVAPRGRRWRWVAAAAVLALAAGGWKLWRDRSVPAPADVMTLRFEIPPSVRMPETGSFALSPDGRRLVFAGFGADGRFGLWERSMESLETRPIKGTEGEVAANTTMFWSPDSRAIGFYADGAVKRIDRSGGQVQTVCRVPGIAVGGAWNRRDEIVVGNTAGGLLRCPAHGGDPVVVVEPGDKTGHLFPAFLPDGRRLLYLRLSRVDPSAIGLYVADLDRQASDQSQTRLLETGYSVKFAPTGDERGHILFVRNRGVWAVPFDTRQLAITGEAMMVVESVGIFRDGAAFDTNGTVLVHRGGSPDFQLSWRDRRGGDLGPVGDPGQYRGVALSPDGRHAAVTRDNKLNRSDHDLWLVDLQRNTTTRLTSDGFAESTPTWTADSRSLLFARGAETADIIYRPLDEGPEQTLVRAPHPGDVLLNPLFTTMSIGAHGEWLAYSVEARGSTRYDIWMVPLRPPGTRPMPLVQQEFEQTQPSLSPNGEWLAYVSNESGANQVMVRPVRRGAGGVLLPGGAVAVSRGGGRSPRWRADSKELYFQATDGGIMAVTAGAIGEPARLFTIQGALAEWGVAPNGERFLFAVPAAGHEPPFTVVLNWLSAPK